MIRYNIVITKFFSHLKVETSDIDEWWGVFSYPKGCLQKSVKKKVGAAEL